MSDQDSGGAGPGDLVVAERIAGAALGFGRAKVVERLGRPDEPGAISLFAAQTFGLPIAFPPEVEAQAAAAQPVTLAGRTDLRDLPLVTIDGADARDFDDAVYAEPDADPANPGGWHMVVAIADVAHYVRPGDALDAEARRRANSVYFPDRVLPMLPEALSNGLCSLRPEEDRACLAVHLWYDRRGRKLRHRFVRALMRSRARLVYEQVQAAADGTPDDVTAPLLESVVRPLYGAYAVLAKARRRRGTLGPRPPGGGGSARSRRPATGDRHAAAPGFAPADRGVHDRRQRRRGGDARSGGHALHVPHPRCARSDQARGARPAAPEPRHGAVGRARSRVPPTCRACSSS